MKIDYRCCDRFNNSEWYVIESRGHMEWDLEAGDGYHTAARDVEFCPYCGTKLPKENK